MTFPSSSYVFDEELSWVKHRFEKWSHCEQAIGICSLLKQFPNTTLRFIQSKIESTFDLSGDGDKNKWLEQKSNNRSYITELCDSYKSLTNTTSDVQLNNNNNNNTNNNNSNNNNNINSNNYSNNNNANTNHNSNLNLVTEKFSAKEEILKEILNCILMLKIGNDDVIQEYLALIPFLVHDTHRRIINIDVIMQTLSILLAHPALSSEDLRTVKEHVERLKYIINVQHGQCPSTDWQAIAPPYVIKTPSNNIFSSLSSVGSSQIQNENLTYDTQSDYIDTDVGSAGRSSGGGSDFHIPSISLINKRHSQMQDDHYGFLSQTLDDQNISFSKNGTEIPDFNPDVEQTNNQFNSIFDTLPFNSFMDNAALKTRRSNSLTTGGIKHNEQLLAAVYTSSTENLTHIMHKPRSYSLSIEKPRLLMTASGSETRLDDLKPSYKTFQTQNPGMKYVGVWLKRLRLHKYTYIFQNFTYEQMMEITDEYLDQLTVTQGARKKLLNSIQKLKERYTKLLQTEQDIMNGKITITAAIELLTDVVATPMKPIEMYNTTDVATQFLKLLGAVCKIMEAKQVTQQDEDLVKKLIEIFDIAKIENNEPFVAHTYQLKELRFRIEKIRMEFPPKSHYHKSGSTSSNGNVNKPRWASLAKPHSKNGNEIKPHRKNSNPMSNFNFVTIQQIQKPQKQSHSKGSIASKSKKTYLTSNGYHQIPTSSYSKSSSYPNFSSNSGSNGNSGGSSSNSQKYIGLNGQTTNPHHSYHRHSVSNLITITPSITTASIVTPNTPISHYQKTSSCVGLQLTSQSSLVNSTQAKTPITSSTILSQLGYCSLDTPVSTIGRSSSTGGSSSYNKQQTNKHSLGDISPYRDLEFLSLQMTEQAIN